MERVASIAMKRDCPFFAALCSLHGRVATVLHAAFSGPAGPAGGEAVKRSSRRASSRCERRSPRQRTTRRPEGSSV